jgi:hypothetical protein
MKGKPKDSCKEMFSKLGILTFCAQYIFSILMFVVKLKDLFRKNMELHKINTCQKSDLHVLLVSLTKVQKGVYCDMLPESWNIGFGQYRRIRHNAPLKALCGQQLIETVPKQ